MLFFVIPTLAIATMFYVLGPHRERQWKRIPDSDIFPQDAFERKIKLILDRVCYVTGHSPGELRSGSRKDDIIAAKALYFILCRRAGITDGKAARAIGLDRTMAIHYNKHYKESQSFKQYRRSYEEIFGDS